MPRVINGQLFIAPTAVTIIDDSALNGVTIGGSGALAIVGEAFGGQPQTPIRLTSAGQAAQIFNSGPLLQAIQRAFSSGPDVPGAPLVYAVRVNPGTQSTLTLNAGAVSALTTPTTPTLAPAGGGTLALGAYAYRLSAINGNGETLGSSEVSLTLANINVPVLGAPSTATTGGTLAAASYFYKLTALNALGETIASNEATQVTTGATSTVTLTWAAITGATGYKLYRSTVTGTETLLTTLGLVTTYIDTGAATPGTAVPPGTNTTGGNAVAITWATTSGATGYHVYGRSAGAEQLITTVWGQAATTFTDTGALTPAGVLPATNTTAGPAPAITLTSTDYGAQTKAVRVNVLSGTGSLGKQYQVAYGPNLISRDQVNRHAIAVQALDTTATYTAVSLEIQGTMLTIVLTPTSGNAVIQTVDLNVYQTLQAVVDRINALGSGLLAAVTAFNPADPSTYLDEVPPTSIRTTVASASSIEFWANAKAALDFFNTQSGSVTAALATGGVRKPPDNLAGWTYLAGGNDYGFDINNNVKQASQTTDWQNALNAMLSVDISVITVATPLATIHAMLQAHVDQASSIQGKMERIAVIGGDMNETITTVQGRAQSVRDPRFMLVYPGAIDIDRTQPNVGNTVNIPPYLLAAQLGGMFCGQGVAEALTHRYISVLGLETKLAPGDVDNLLLSGVCPIENVVNKGFRIVQSRSTWTADTNYRRNEISVMRASDELAKRVRNAAADFLIGRIIGPDLLDTAKSITISALRAAQRDGLIVGNPAYRNIVITATGDFVTIDFEASIAIPANYVQITAHLTPFAGSISA